MLAVLNRFLNTLTVELNIQTIKNWIQHNANYLWPVLVFFMAWVEYSAEEAFYILVVIYLYLIGTFEVLSNLVITILDEIQTKSVKASFQKYYTQKRCLSNVAIVLVMVGFAWVFDVGQAMRYAVAVGMTLAILIPIFVKTLLSYTI